MFVICKNHFCYKGDTVDFMFWRNMLLMVSVNTFCCMHCISLYRCKCISLYRTRDPVDQMLLMPCFSVCSSAACKFVSNRSHLKKQIIIKWFIIQKNTHKYSIKVFVRHTFCLKISLPVTGTFMCILNLSD